MCLKFVWNKNAQTAALANSRWSEVNHVIMLIYIYIKWFHIHWINTSDDWQKKDLAAEEVCVQCEE